jgi:hypothetical protein
MSPRYEGKPSDGLAVVDVDAGLLAGQHSTQRGARLVLPGEAAAAQRLALSVDGREVDGERPAAVAAVGQLGAARTELFAGGVPAGAAAIDLASVRVPARDRDPSVPLICRG